MSALGPASHLCSRKFGGGGRPLASIFEAEGAERYSQGPGTLRHECVLPVRRYRRGRAGDPKRVSERCLQVRRPRAD
jgi:hypothetical protein